MRKPTIFTAAFLLVIASLSFVKAPDWYLLETKNYELYFPAKPLKQVRTLNASDTTVKVYLHYYQPTDSSDDNKLYMFAETPLDDVTMSSDTKDKLPGFFHAFINGVVESAHGKLTSETDIQISGYPGKQYRVEMNNGAALLNICAYVVKQSTYVLQTVTWTRKYPNPSSDRFLHSLVIKD